MPKFDDLLEFMVPASNDADLTFKTIVSYAVQGDREVVRIEQASALDDKDVDVVILDKIDFDRIHAMLKGH